MSDPLDQNGTDYFVSVAKSALGAVPGVGSALSELAGSIIPRQRMDRLVDFARLLEVRLGKADQDLLRAKLTNENFVDLVEESVRQAAQAVTDERKEYLTSLLAMGLSESHISAAETRHLLRILGDVNDVEIIWLRFYCSPTLNGDNEFRTKHAEVIKPIRTSLSSSQETRDRDALQKNYTEHLVSLGLLARPLQCDARTRLPEFDAHTGNWKTGSPTVTPFGKLLLRHIGLQLPER